MPYRFHVLGIPHTATNKQWVACAFTQKVLRLCAMLQRCGHCVIHYGNADSQVECSEHVTVTDRDDIGAPADYLGYDLSSPVYAKFHRNAAQEIAKRQRSLDFLLCMWGAGHKAVADALQRRRLIVVEPGIGYGGGWFAPYKVFESYALLHAAAGMRAVSDCGHNSWYDVVIPNYFDLSDFTFEPRKQGYFLFLGRIGVGKGTHIAMELASKFGGNLVVAGPGERPDGYCRFVGMVGAEERRRLLADAKALLAPSTYMEPFCGTVIEANLSGTPSITTDWGAFTETVLHGITGYRCRTFEQFLWAAEHVDQISPYACRAWAEMNFSMQRVAEMYEEYWRALMDLWTGKGWYQPRDDRHSLDALKRRYPSDPSWALRLPSMAA